MATNESRSLTDSLKEGSTDGKYRKARPNTTVAPGKGEELVSANRRGLHPYWNYDFIEQEATNTVNPVDTDVSTAPRAPMNNVAHEFNNQMGANY